MEFLTVTNLLACIDVFIGYMSKNYSMDVFSFIDEQQLKEEMYEAMYSVYNASPGSKVLPIKELNNRAMNIVKQSLLKKRISTRPNPQTLEREQSVLGNQTRPILYEKHIPISTNLKSIDEDVNRTYEQVMQDRNEKIEPPSTPVQLTSVIEDVPFSSDEFQQKIAEMEATRDIDKRLEDRRQATVIIQNKGDVDPKELYKSFIENNNDHGNNNSLMSDKYIKSAPRIEENVIKEPRSKISEMYVSINAADRNWKDQPMRYKYVVDFNSTKENAIRETPRDIESVKVSFVIVPAEIFESRTQSLLPKTQFQHEFSFAYPYIVLRIDELSNKYDGTNDVVRNCFCKLMFDKTYRAPNGRGYMVLKPMQDEKRTFFPNRLSLLQQMTISLLKPNGTLFNNSADDYRLFKLEHEPFNPLYLKMVIDKYFDKNEFFIGDHVNFQNFNVTRGLNDAVADRLQFFVNRKEGHDIVQLGKPNDSGFYNAFYILAPGVIDQKEGKMNIDNGAIDLLNLHNSKIDWKTHNDTCGEIMNVSLQNVLAMKFFVNTLDSSSVV